jgi:solute carrier family 35 (adenosine 3'-phospho 5'-phosphosulfate transporter), member B2
MSSKNVDNNNNSSDKLKIILNLPPPATKSPQDDERWNGKKLRMFLFCFGGLQLSFLLWGLLQERIIKFSYASTLSASDLNGSQVADQHKLNIAYKEDLQKFKSSQFLVLTNRLAGLILSSIILLVCNRNNSSFAVNPSWRKIISDKNWAPLFVCSYSSMSNVLSSWFQYESLKYVTFTTQLLAKSSKSVFVMLTGKVVSNKSYKAHEYFSVCLIALGVFLFSDLNNTKSNSEVMYTSFPGLLCLLGYLVSDSFTSTWQDNLNKTHSMSSIALMFITNVYSCLFTLVGLTSQNELEESLKFLREHSQITHHVALLSLTSAIGQIFIFVTIKKFGALVFSLIMTSRQVLSIVLSSIIFEHYLSVQSVFGISLIFFALFFQQFLKMNILNCLKKWSDAKKIITQL